MYRPPARQAAESTAYDYNLQATNAHEDDDEDHQAAAPIAEKRRRPLGKRPNYKPTALTWPFLVLQIVLLGIALGLIVWAEKSMPDSDSTAIIDPVPSEVPARRAEFNRIFRRDNSSSSSVVDLETTTTSFSQPTTALLSTGAVSPSGSITVTPSTSATVVSSTHVEASSSVVFPSDKTSQEGTIVSTSGSTTPANKQVVTSLTDHASSTTAQVSPATSSAAASDGSSSGTTSHSTGAVTTSNTATHSTSSPASGGASSSSGTKPSLQGESSTSSTGQAGKSGVTDTNSITTATSVSSSSGSTSSSSGDPFRKNGGIISVDTAATNTTTSLITTTLTSNFTTTLRSSVSFVSTLTIPEHTTTFNVTSSTRITTSHTVTKTFSNPASTHSTSFTLTSTSSSTVVLSFTPDESHASTRPPVTTVVASDFTTVVASYTVVSPTQVTTEIVEPTTIESFTVFPTTSQVPASTVESTIQTYVPYLSTGQTVITSVQTIIIQPPQTQVATTQAPVTVVGTSVIGGQVYTIVNTFAPETKVLGNTGGPATQVSIPPPQTIVTQVGGTLVTNYIVITPKPTSQTVSLNVESTIGGQSITFVQTQAPQTFVTSQGGSLVTLTTTPPPQTQVTVVGGTRTTVPVFSTSTGFQPISYALTTKIGGSTSVVTATGGPTKVVTTINGTPVTIDTTIAPTTYTTTFGGTLVTEMTATTPTGTDPITLTLASTIGGTLTTIVQTFAPSTYVTDISGKLSTIVTTPSPSTWLSTAPLTTSTFTSTSTPTKAQTATSGAPPAVTSTIVTTKTFDLTSREYFVGTFLTPIIAVSLVIPIRIIDLNAKLYQPFNSLAKPGGASGYEAMTLQFTGLMGFITPAVTLLQGHPVPFITTLMVGCASFMVPLAVEAISLKLHGHCNLLSSQGCAAALGVSAATNHALIALAVVIILLIIALIFILRGWVTGLNANPWNIAGIASLARNPDVRILHGSDVSLRRSVADKQYGLGYYESPSGREEYGLLLADDSRGLSGYQSDRASIDSEPVVWIGKDGKRKGKSLPFMTLRYPWRVCFLLYLVGLVVLIAYYDYTLVAQVSEPGVPRFAKFHLFFDSHSFGIRFLFASMGVVITFCWQAFFVAVATIVPYHAMAYRTQSPQKSILVSRPTNAFYGIYLAIKQRHLFYVSACLMAILSEFLPILLSNIPHKLTQVLLPTLVCTRISLAILSAMILVILYSFFIRWPPMPVDPRSVAGALWYVCESRMLDDFAGVSEMSGKERDRRVREMGKRYYYGDLMGRTRIGVDADPGHGEGVVTSYHGAGGGGGVLLDPAPNEGPPGLAVGTAWNLPPARGGGGGSVAELPLPANNNTGGSAPGPVGGGGMFARRDEPPPGWSEDPAPNSRS